MNDFSIGGAWSHGFRFFTGRWLAHAAILIIGVAVPFGVDLAMADRLAWTGARPSPMGARMFDHPELLLVLALGYFCQTGSYFTSWRLGFDERRSVGGALAFGLPAGLIAVICIFVAFAAAAFLWEPLLTPDTAFLAFLVFLLPLILVSAIYFLVGLAFLAAALILFLGFAMIFGAATGQMGLAATATGGSGTIAVLLIILAGVSFWVAARLSCVTSVMADRRSLNLFTAVAESWRLSWEEQWAITRYLALIGGVLALLLVGAAFAIGFSTNAMLPGQENLFETNGAKLAGALLGIAFAFLAVGVPAGIYRQLVGEDTSAEIFE